MPDSRERDCNPENSKAPLTNAKIGHKPKQMSLQDLQKEMMSQDELKEVYGQRHNPPGGSPAKLFNPSRLESMGCALVTLGGCERIGCSCHLLRFHDRNFLLDCGGEPSSGRIEMRLPVISILKDVRVDGIFISHAHNDHIGSLPDLLLNSATPSLSKARLFLTPTSTDLAPILFKDTSELRRSKGYDQHYSEVELEDIVKKTERVKYDKPFSVGGVKVTFFDAGHVPGAAMMLFEADGRKVLYTGDFNLGKSTLFGSAGEKTLKKLEKQAPFDAVIMEGTYLGTDEEHDVLSAEKRLITFIKHVTSRKGVVLVPVFGLGRAQEILAAVGRARTKKRLPKKLPVYLGGLARTITHCLIEKKFETPAHDELLSEFKRAKFIRRGWNGLVVESNGAIEDLTDFSDLAGSICIVTSGMLLKETLSGIILDKIKDDPKSGVAIVGYQDEDSPFWYPAEKVKCIIKEFHASAHASKRQLEELAKLGKNVVLVHCEARSFALPKNWCRPKDLTIVNLETLEMERFATDESSFIGWGLAQVTVASEPVEKLNRIAEQLESVTRVLRVRSEGTESGGRIIFTVKAGKSQCIDDCLNRFKLEKSVLDVAPVSSIGSFDVTRQMVLNKFDELCRWLEIPPCSVEEPEIELFDYRDGCERSFFNRETGTVGFCRQLLCSDEEVLFPAFVFYEFARYLFSRMDWWKPWRGSGNKHLWEIFGLSLARDVEATDDELKRVAELIRNRKMEDWKYWPCN